MLEVKEAGGLGGVSEEGWGGRGMRKEGVGGALGQGEVVGMEVVSKEVELGLVMMGVVMAVLSDQWVELVGWVGLVGWVMEVGKIGVLI